MLIVAIAVYVLMIIAWLIHIAVCWHWDFRAWYNDSDEDHMFDGYFCAVTGLPCCGCSFFCEHRKKGVN